MQPLGRLEYELINETKCGEEELFGLIAGFAPEYGLPPLLSALASLVSSGHLACQVGSGRQDIVVTYQMLQQYVRCREAAGEQLDQYPAACAEYSFRATERGLALLSESDKPIGAG